MNNQIYSYLSIPLYNLWIYQINSRFAWGCSLDTLNRLYRENVSAPHSEVGLATTYFVKADIAPGTPLLLIDITQDTLNRAKQKLKNEYEVEIVCADILNPIKTDKKVKSIGLNYVLHCVAGNLKPESKGRCFQNLKNLLEPGGVLFGSTILGQGVKHNRFGKFLLEKFNNIGVFSNLEDNIEDLRESLQLTFKHVEIKLSNTVALFKAHD